MRRLTKQLLITMAVMAISFSFALFSPFTSMNAYAASKGNPPIAHWRFDEGGGPTAYDESANNNDGTLVNHAKFVPGKIGKALQFDGTDDYVGIGEGTYPTIPILQFDSPTSKFTLEAWIKPNSATSHGEIIAKYRGWDRYGWDFYQDGTNLVLKVWEIEADVNSQVNITANNALTIGVWQYVVGVWDVELDRQYLYVNGVLVKEDTKSVVDIGDGDNAKPMIGYDRWGGGGEGNYFSGLIDDVRIYNYVRTADQIMVDYNAGLAVHLGAGTDPNEGNPPVGYWMLDENTGTTAYDRSGNGNNGILTNMESTDWVTGKYGSALQFDGGGSNEYISLSKINALEGSVDYTISAWIKMTIAQNGGVVGQFDAGSHIIAIYISGSDGIASFVTYEGSYSNVSSNTVVNNGQWRYITIVKSGTTGRIYIDGLEKNSGTVKNVVSTTEIRIGTRENGAYSFNGLIDDVKIYNYARTQAQIAYDYNKGKPVAQYKFDEGGGAITHNEYSSADTGTAPVGLWRMDNNWNDSSGNGNNGTATGATFSTSGKIGPYAGSFDGTDVMKIPTSSNLAFGTSDFFIGYWVYPTSYSAIANCFWDFRDGTNGAYFSDQIYSQKYRIYVNSNPILDSVASIPLNNWTYIAISRSGTSLKVFLNGNLDTTISDSTNYLAPASNVWFGISSMSGQQTSSFSASSSIDDVRIYNYARTAEQIYNDYKTTHGTLVGDTKFVDGKIGKALEFDGTGDYVQLTSDIFGISNNDFTVTAWAYSDDFGSDENSIYDIQDNAGDVVLLSAGGSGGYQFRFLIRGDNGSYGTQLNTEINNVAFVGSWHHLAASYVHSIKTATLYADGKNIGTATGTFSNFLDGTINRHEIGVSSGGTRFHDGKIDDVRIYNYARTADQVMQDYNAGAVRLGASATYAVGWRDKNWHYRKPVTLTNGGTQELLSHQILVTVDTAALITAGKMKSNGEDIRFTNQVGNQYLAYWVESGINTASTKIWVKVDRINVGTNATTIYMYYGNPNALASQSGINTFVFFDDFNDNSINSNKWTQLSGTNWVESDGVLREMESRQSGDNVESDIYYPGGLSWTDYIFEGKLYADTSSYPGVYVRVKDPAIGNTTVWWHEWQTSTNTGTMRPVNSNTDGSWAYTWTGTTSTGVGVWRDFRVDVWGNNYRSYLNGVVVNNLQPVNVGHQITNGTIGLGQHQGYSSPQKVYFDDVRVRKFAATEPSSAAPGTEELSPGPVAHWRMDEATSGAVPTTAGAIKDESSNNNDGTASNTTWTYTTGKFGGALSFDGNDYVEVQNYFNLDIATLELWFKSNEWASYPILISKNAGGASGYIQYYQSQLRFYAPGNVVTVNWGNPSLSNWHHLVLVVTGTNHLAYLDGSLVGSPVASSLGLFTGNYNFQIGRYHTGSYYFSGLIDDVRIYNYARTVDQILQDYNQGLASKLGE